MPIEAVTSSDSEHESWIDKPLKRKTTSAVYLLVEQAFSDIYGPNERSAISSRIEIHPS